MFFYKSCSWIKFPERPKLIVENMTRGGDNLRVDFSLPIITTVKGNFYIEG